MNVPEAFDSVIPSALARRLKELVAQSLHYRSKMEEIVAELEKINIQIQNLSPKGSAASPGANRDQSANSRS